LFGLNLDACTTWMCVNSFSSWLSSLVTIFISGTALIISIKAYAHTKSKDTESLKITLSTCLIQNGGSSISAFGIEVINTGHRKAIVENYIWLVKPPFKKAFQVLSWVAINQFTAMSGKLPAILEEGAKVNFFNGIKLFVELPEAIFNRKFISAWLTIRTLKICVSTTRNSYVINVPSGIKSLIWSQYRKQKA